MTSQTTMTAPDRARVLRGWFESQGFELNQPSILQPAGVFVDLSGEDIRRRLYTVSDPEGRELCLRPDFTIPVARAYLEAGAPAERRFCYSGTAFRYRRGDAVDEFEQAGIEIFGAGDARGAEREILRLALRSVMAEGLTRITLRAGDIGLFETLLAALELPDYWHRRIRRHFWRHDLVESLNAELARPRESAGEAMAAALEGLDRDAASDMVEEVLALAGIVPVGGRSAEEIAQRFMERASSGAGTLPEKAVALIQDYLAIAGEPEPALEQLDAMMRSSGLSLSKEIAALRERLEDMVEIARETELPPEVIRFEAGFGRNMEYYTGLVFEICHADRPELRQIASGGRYDDLLSDLGAPSTIPAVGCGLYVDRLIAALRDARP